MAGSSNQFTYQMGGTQIAVGASLALAVVPPAGCNGWIVSKFSGGTMSFVTAATLKAGGLGYVPQATEVVTSDGPALFFLASTSGATVVANVMFKFSAGYSLLA